MWTPTIKSTFSLIHQSKIWFFRVFADLIVGTLSTCNPLRVQTINIKRGHSQAKKQPVREVSNWGKMWFVFPNILLLFSQEKKINKIWYY